MCYQILFSKKTKTTAFCRSENFESFVSILLRDVEGIWSGLSLQNLGDHLLEGQAYGRHSALGGKQIHKKCPYWTVHANVSHCFSRSLQCCFVASKKCMMGGWLLSILVGSSITKYLVT